MRLEPLLPQVFVGQAWNLSVVRRGGRRKPAGYKPVLPTLRGAPGPGRPAKRSKSETTSAQTETRIPETKASTIRASRLFAAALRPGAGWRARSNTRSPAGTPRREARRQI